MKSVYNKATGAEIIVYEDPKVVGRYALPVNAIEIAPPDFDPATHTCAFDGSQWVLTAIPEPKPEAEPEPYIETYADKRRQEYGLPENQLEYITEYGLEAWQQKVAKIKTKYPKE